MKPGDETPQNWQQPAENLSQAPYQAPESIPESDPIQPQREYDDTSNPVSQVSMDQQNAEEDDINSEADDEQGEFPQSPLEAFSDSSDDAALLRWQATEYISHERTGVWYAVLTLVVLVFIALAILVFDSITFAILIPVMLVSLVVYIRRPPSVLSYTISRKGLHVNDHLYTYDQFKAFGIVTHEESHSVVLLPRKRFQVSQTVYFPEEVGEPLVDMLASRLPMQEVKLDAIDRLLKKLRI